MVLGDITFEISKLATEQIFAVKRVVTVIEIEQVCYSKFRTSAVAKSYTDGQPNVWHREA